MSTSTPQSASHGHAQRYLSDPDLDVWLGDALECLQQLPDDHAQMCVTSPPFYGLRDYGVERQIGLEPTVGDWVDALVKVFAEVRRVLRPDGTLWLELADSYNSGTAALRKPSGASTHGNWERGGSMGDQRIHDTATKPKDLLGAPFEVVFALRADGWYWRQTIIWHKPNAMPESASDRPTTGHSYVFLLSPSARYFYDDEAIAEPAEWARWGNQDAGKYEQVGKGSLVQPLTREQIARRFGGGRQRGAGQGGYKTTDERNERFQGTLVDVDPEPTDELDTSWHDHSSDLERGNGRQRASDGRPAGTVRYDGWKAALDAGDALKRARSVWSIATEPNRIAVCSVCEAYWQGDHPDEHCGVEVVEHFAAFARQLVQRTILAGSRPGDTVLDPFGGSGTTAVVARELGRKAVLVELRREYAVMIRERTRQQSLLTADEG